LLVEDIWHGRVFGTEWRTAAGGPMDVLEPATGNKITSVGSTTAADVREAAAEARAAQPGWAATPYEERAASASGASGNDTRIGGPANWDEFTQWQWMTINEKPNPYPF
jgi:hypothetical protein